METGQVSGPRVSGQLVFMCFFISSSILWGEGFEFTCLSISKDITVHLYKDTDKKKKKDKDYIGLVNLSVNTLLNHNFVEKW